MPERRGDVMIIGAHSIIYSTNPDADRAFFRDVLGLPGVDVGEGYLIFGLPPAEVAVHQYSANDHHELYLMCDDVEAFASDMKKRGAACGPVQAQSWGLLTTVSLPGGGKLGVYQPRHARPKAAGGKPAKRTGKPAGKSAARAKAAKKPSARPPRAAKRPAAKKKSRRR
jgi:catechol 2,3-dioxygenase-like lactoylglutathione lyase family enzyme